MIKVHVRPIVLSSRHKNSSFVFSVSFPALDLDWRKDKERDVGETQCEQGPRASTDGSCSTSLDRLSDFQFCELNALGR